MNRGWTLSEYLLPGATPPQRGPWLPVKRMPGWLIRGTDNVARFLCPLDDGIGHGSDRDARTSPFASGNPNQSNSFPGESHVTDSAGRSSCVPNGEPAEES